MVIRDFVYSLWQPVFRLPFFVHQKSLHKSTMWKVQGNKYNTNIH